MKKLCIIILSFVLLIGFVSCRSTKAYTEEFPYLPAYYNNIKSDTSPSYDKITGFSKATYTIVNTTNTEVFLNYENILKNDDWTITQDQNPDSIVANKGTHQATIKTQVAGKDVKLLILTK